MSEDVTTVTPNPGVGMPALISTSNHRDRHYRDDNLDRFVASETDRVLREQAAGFRHAANEHTDIVRDVKETQAVIERATCGTAKYQDVSLLDHNLERGFHALTDIARQVEVRVTSQFADLRLQAQTNFAEIRDVIRTDGDKTRTLIDTLEREKLRDKLAEAKNILLVNKIPSPV